MISNKLDRPFKRVMFLLLLLSASGLTLRALLPTPFEIEYFTTWKEHATDYVGKRQVTIVKTDCALKQSSPSEKLYLDMLALEVLVNKNEFTNLLNGRQLEGNKTSKKNDLFLFHEAERESWEELLLDEAQLCVHEYCVEVLTTDLFSQLLTSCGKQKTEYEVNEWSLDIKLAENLLEGGELSLWMFVVMAVSALSSIFYDSTLGKLICWILMKDKS